MTDGKGKSEAERDRTDARNENDRSIIPGQHGKHGGGMESEGKPQEQSPESAQPPERNGADRSRH
jgi:hypothetical protein